jgi:hypothetical protein
MKRPINAAETPRKKIAILKAIEVLVEDQPKVFSSGIFHAL